MPRSAAVLDGLRERGHLADIDVHFGRLVAELDGRDGPELPLAGALASEAARAGHVCLGLSDVAGRDWPAADGTPLPDSATWERALKTSPAIARPGDEAPRPLVLDGQGRLYLARFWSAEQAVAAGLRRLAEANVSEPAGLDDALDRLFPDATPDDRQRTAARTALCRRLCVVSGGPGTGKTYTVAAIVALLLELGIVPPGRIALAAPTGKAAARLQEAVRARFRERAATANGASAAAVADYEADATTIHRLLFRRNGQNRLPVDALVLDEGSMVDLGLMARVMDALPDGARLVVLGDASQLASVQPGSVFADLCQADPASRSPLAPASDARETRAFPGRAPLERCVVTLTRNFRFDEAGGIGRLAAAVVRGAAADALAALADPSDEETEMRPLADVRAFERLAAEFTDAHFAPLLQTVQDMREPTADGTGLLARFRVLCAHRTGPFGAERFNRSVERRLRARGLASARDEFYPGRPILVTRNDQRTGLSNGDTGVVLRTAAGRLQVWFPELQDADGRPRLVAPARLPRHESFYAMTVHRAQGSEYDEVAIVPGPADSRVATRELLYTAVTRARRRVVVYGDEAGVTAAVERPSTRSSGLRDALAAP